MTKKRRQIKSECPECGCGLIHNMTPDQYREKYGDSLDKVTVNCNECGTDYEGSVTEEHPSSQNRTE